MRHPHDKLIGGVCGGIADFLDTNPKAIRMISFVVLILPTLGLGPLFYVLLWLFLPVGSQECGLLKPPIIQSKRRRRAK